MMAILEIILARYRINIANIKTYVSNINTIIYVSEQNNPNIVLDQYVFTDFAYFSQNARPHQKNTQYKTIVPYIIRLLVCVAHDYIVSYRCSEAEPVVRHKHR